jgi:hypothetical protein
MNSRQPADFASRRTGEFFFALVSYCEKWKCSSFVRDYAKRGAQKARLGDEFISAAERALQKEREKSTAEQHHIDNNKQRARSAHDNTHQHSARLQITSSY